MNNQIKFTSDGKKVAIVGKLNNLETIVQEIFVMDGNEIPSGENFVVKSLHDAPAISWKEKDLKDRESRYDKERKEWDNKIDEQRKRFEILSNNLKDRISFTAGAVKNVNEESFNLLLKFIDGKIKFVVDGGNWDKEIKSFDKETGGQYDYYHSWDKVKLLTLYGSDDGNLQLHINKYSDGSGGSTFVHVFEKHEDAVSCVAQWVNEGDLNSTKISRAKEYKITIDPQKMNDYKNLQISLIEQSIEKQKKELEKSKKQIEEISQLG